MSNQPSNHDSEKSSLKPIEGANRALQPIEFAILERCALWILAYYSRSR